MQKKLSLLLIVAILATTTALFSQQIGEITSITQSRYIKGYDQYIGRIVGFEDRIFVTSAEHLQELRILPDGSLVQLSVYEQGQHNISDTLLIDENRLYVPYYEGPLGMFNVNRRGRLMVFDLTTTPMTLIETVELPQTFETRIFLYSMGDHILIEDNSDEMEYHLLLYRLRKDTLTFDAPIITYPGVVGDPIIDGLKYTIWLDTVLNKYFIITYDMTIEVPFSEWGAWFYLMEVDVDLALSIEFIEDKLVVYAYNQILFYDISDLQNVRLASTLNLNDDIPQWFWSRTFYRDLYFIGKTEHELRIYDISDPDNVSLIHGVKEQHGSLYIHDDKLFTSAHYSVNTHDLSNNFQRTRYGTSNYADYISGEYFVENNRYTNETTIYSLLEDEPEVITIFADNLESDVYFIGSIQKEGDLLYTIASQVNGSVPYDYNFDVYQIADGNAQLVSRVPLSTGGSIRKVRDYVLIQDPGIEATSSRVYRLIDNEWLLDGEYSGMPAFSVSSGYESPNYILNFNTNRQIEFRDINDPLVVLRTADTVFPAFPNFTLFYHVSENVIMLTSTYDRHILYTYDPQANIFNQTDVFYANGDIYYDIFAVLDKGILFRPGDNPFHFIIYDINSGVAREIGQWHNAPILFSVSIFPDHNKLFTRSIGSYQAFDISYTVSESDMVITPATSALYANYPNPFNPSTTITFSLFTAGEVSIDIYNVRGQRVRSLVSGVYEAGVHSVVWNGVSDDGVGVGSGVYFYRMVSGGFSGVKKMLLVK